MSSIVITCISYVAPGVRSLSWNGDPSSLMTMLRMDLFGSESGITFSLKPE